MTSSELQPWTVSESRHVVTSPWMNLRADVCETADGVKLDPFYVMEAPDWVHIVPFDSDDRLLVTRQYRHGNEQIQWEIPCGMVDEADASPLAAAQRELLEETGCTADKFVDLPMVYANPARQNNRLHTFLAQGVRVTSEQNLDAAESIEYEFVEVDVVLDWLREGRFQNALLVSSLLMALSQRFH